jgi:hypothetical protein
MPPRKQPKQLDLVEQANALPPLNHNSEVTDNDLIAENHKLEDLLKAALAKYNEWAKPHKARIDEIENEIQRRLLERGADSTKTEAGTAYISNIMNQKVESVETLFDFVADNWADVGAEVKISVPVGVVRTHMEANEGRPPPGISISYFKRLNINRS